MLFRTQFFGAHMSTNRTHHGWILLFKFGQRRFLEELRKHGLLYMNPSTLFAELERQAFEKDIMVNRAQADRFEGSDFIYHPNDHEITIEGPGAMGSNGKVQNFKVTIPPGETAAHTSLSLDALSCNIYCMYATTVPQGVDKRNFKFGDSFVIIRNTQEFLNRFSSVADALSLQHQCNLVDYYDLDKHSGPTGPFRKPSSFAYQNEFRLVVRPGCDQARRLEIGNIEDITSEVLPLREINEIFDFSPESAQKAGLSW
jgi:hypothetical protein